MVEHQCKEIFYELIKDKLPEPILSTVNISMQVYKCRAKNGKIKRLDKGNVYAILSKYFFDSLTEKGTLPDDNDSFIKREIIIPTDYINPGEEEYGEFIISVNE